MSENIKTLKSSHTNNTEEENKNEEPAKKKE
jgi:hypothetical protein